MEIAEQLKDLIKDKIVCDVGCGDFKQAEAFAPHCKGVIGVDIKWGFDGFRMSPPEADIYYVCTGMETNEQIHENLKNQNKPIIYRAIGVQENNDWFEGKIISNELKLWQ